MAVAACFHCGELLSDTPCTDAAGRGFCCAGCAAAARWIVDAGLADYYRWRDAAPRIDGPPRAHAEWDRDDFLERHAPLRAGVREITLAVEGMQCAACAWLIERALSRVPGVRDASAAFGTRRARVRFDLATRASELPALLERLGYRVNPEGSAAAGRARADAARGEVLRLGIAGICAMQAMMFSEALYFGAGMDVATRDAFRWLALLLGAPAVLYSAWPIYRGAWREVAHARLGMDTPVALSIALAYGASVVGTLTGGAEVWFDAAVMFVVLVLGARALEARLRRRAQAAVEALAQVQSESIERIDADGAVHAVPIESLAAGDRVRVRVGQALPADGLVEAGACEVDEALLTGEPRAMRKGVGDAVFAGSVCVATPFVLRVTAAGAGTLRAQILRLAERAAEARPRLARLAERAAAVFVGAVLLAALATALYSRDVGATLAVLVVSCPCALALAVPAALAAAQARLAQLGVLAVAPDAIERLSRIDRVVLDKTGTLTRGAPALVATDAVDAGESRACAAALERGSQHPIARAFAPFDDGRAVVEIREHAGQGIAGTIDGVRYRLGCAEFTGACGAALSLARGAEIIARFELADTLRDDAAAACAALRAQGLALEVLSGDAEPAVADVCGRLAIDTYRAAQRPADKLVRVRALQARGARVAMIGDGVNDAPVLAGADLAIALGSGAAAAHGAADLVVLGGRLGRIAEAVALARRTRRVMRQNLAWALAYNLVSIPFAAAGLVAPWLAALGMTLSSLAVTLNAARLSRERVA